MKKTVLTFGLISGAVSALLMICTVPFIDRIGFDHGEVIGYTSIVLSFLVVFFGVRSYREQQGGTLTFGRGFTVGLLMTVISCLCYVITWEIIYFNFMPDFADKYSAYAVEHVRASGGTQQAIDMTVKQMQAFKEMYANPWMNAAMTFVEPFPVGLAVTAISAVALRKKPAKAIAQA